MDLNLNYEAMKSNLNTEEIDLNVNSKATKSYLDSESNKSNVNLKELIRSNLHDVITSGLDYDNIPSDAEMKQFSIQEQNTLRELIDETEKHDSEDSIEVSRSIVDNWVVQGSFHQGDKRFGINSGKQCVANCLSALAHSKLKDLNDWDSMYLDNVLIDGNRMYSNIHGNNIHLLVSELPEISEISEKLFKISRKESITAVVDTSGTIDFGEFGNSLPLDQALQESLIDYDACFICAYDTTF
ncbi:unnamed protein product [Mytilus coruscus]|uniref:Peptidase C76 domain-containing protein n=1 Tax=Mytilus coruscus TaxID=42192 RepID=A0A6J8ES96_MYTCO|nr:unnamed protein product [Mytilus coruscus]